MENSRSQELQNKSASFDRLPVSLVITDPRLPDNPIVYCNTAFTELTGYTASAACGRNCRFLQGPETDKTPVRTLAEAIEASHPAAVEIVNYTADGERFLNHLVITPVRENGETLFFMGIQAGWGEDADDLPSSQDILDHLEAFETAVTDQISALLSIIRDEVAHPSEPREIITLLSSRIDCLAQLYAGVFRRHSRGDRDRVRLGAYLGRVCSGTHVADRSYNVRMNTDFAECATDVATAAMVGLALSELLANAFEDTNPYDNGAEIEVELRDGRRADGDGDEDGDTRGARLRVTASSRGDGGTLLPPNGTVGGRLLEHLLPNLNTQAQERNRDGVREVVIPLPMLDTSPSNTLPTDAT